MTYAYIWCECARVRRSLAHCCTRARVRGLVEEEVRACLCQFCDEGFCVRPLWRCFARGLGPHNQGIENAFYDVDDLLPVLVEANVEILHQVVVSAVLDVFLEEAAACDAVFFETVLVRVGRAGEDDADHVVRRALVELDHHRDDLLPFGRLRIEHMKRKLSGRPVELVAAVPVFV